MLILTVAWCGAAIGHQAFAKVGPDVQPPRVWPLIVGDTATGRKGTAEAHTLSALSSLSDIPRRASGLSSGEGLITAFLAEDNQPPPDPRLLVTESEWEAVQAQIKRDRNTLSPVLRDAWDGKPLGTMTVRTRVVEDHHLVVAGQITPSAFRSGVTNLTLANGFMNRFIPILVARPHLIPLPGEGSQQSQKLLEDLIRRCDHAPTGVLELTDRAKRVYTDWYLERETHREDLLERSAQLTARGNANAIRLAVVFALLQGSRTIRTHEIRAAIAIVEYADASASILLGPGEVGLDAKVKSILKSSGGLSRDDLHRALGRHTKAKDLDEALGVLKGAGIVKITTVRTKGRNLTMIELVMAPGR